MRAFVVDGHAVTVASVNQLRNPTPLQSRLGVWLPAAAVGLAFADASIVALALPSIYDQFNTTVVEVSWVLTAYALVVALAALAVAAAARRIRPIVLATTGLALFAVASAVCGLSPDLTWLIIGRCMQGAGAAALLGGCLAVLGATRPGRRGKVLWGMAAGVGLAIGPALGGALTTAFDWRAIFLVQAPVALAAIAMALDPRARSAVETPGRQRIAMAPQLASVFLFAGLVGALFLSVLLIIEVWRFTPLAGAAAVSALPAAMLLARPLATRLSASTAGVSGVVLLCSGLATLAMLPTAHVAWAVAALAACGLGLGLASKAVDPPETDDDAASTRDGSIVVASRHAGLVVGLVVIAPILDATLDSAVDDATQAGTSVVLDADMSLQDKAAVAVALGETHANQPSGEFPDLKAAVAESGVDPETATTLGAALTDEVEAIFTRAFREPFAAAAALTSVTALILIAARRLGKRQSPSPAPSSRGAAVVAAAALAGAVAVTTTAVVSGDSDFGRHRADDPCTAAADTHPGSGLDAATQRVALSALNGTACELDVSRENVVLQLVGRDQPEVPDVGDPEFDQALRSGLARAVDDAVERGDLPGFAADTIRDLAEEAPVELLLEYLGLTD